MPRLTLIIFTVSLPVTNTTSTGLLASSCFFVPGFFSGMSSSSSFLAVFFCFSSTAPLGRRVVTLWIGTVNTLVR